MDKPSREEKSLLTSGSVHRPRTVAHHKTENSTHTWGHSCELRKNTHCAMLRDGQTIARGNFSADFRKCAQTKNGHTPKQGNFKAHLGTQLRVVRKFTLRFLHNATKHSNFLLARSCLHSLIVSAGCAYSATMPKGAWK